MPDDNEDPPLDDEARFELEEVNWKNLLAPGVESELMMKSRTEKVHLIISLILFLQLPLAPLLFFVFKTDHKRVKHVAGNFLRIQGNTNPGDEYHFPAATLYRIWHDRFLKCRVKHEGRSGYIASREASR